MSIKEQPTDQPHWRYCSIWPIFYIENFQITTLHMSIMERRGKKQHPTESLILSDFMYQKQKKFHK